MPEGMCTLLSNQFLSAQVRVDAVIPIPRHIDGCPFSIIEVTVRLGVDDIRLRLSAPPELCSFLAPEDDFTYREVVPYSVYAATRQYDDRKRIAIFAILFLEPMPDGPPRRRNAQVYEVITEDDA